jgi:hypothetical protein
MATPAQNLDLIGKPDRPRSGFSLCARKNTEPAAGNGFRVLFDDRVEQSVKNLRKTHHGGAS